MDKKTLRQAAQNHPESILHPYDALINKDGFDTIYTLCEIIGGATIYVPSIRKMFAQCLEKEALREFNGYNHEALARKYGFSDRHLKKLVKTSSK